MSTFDIWIKNLQCLPDWPEKAKLLDLLSKVSHKEIETEWTYYPYLDLKDEVKTYFCFTGFIKKDPFEFFSDEAKLNYLSVFPEYLCHLLDFRHSNMIDEAGGIGSLSFMMQQIDLDYLDMNPNIINYCSPEENFIVKKMHLLQTDRHGTSFFLDMDMNVRLFDVNKSSFEIVSQLENFVRYCLNWHLNPELPYWSEIYKENDVMREYGINAVQYY